MANLNASNKEKSNNIISSITLNQEVSVPSILSDDGIKNN